MAPMYYDLASSFTSNASAGTQTSGTHLRMLSGTAVDAMIKGVYVGCRMSTAGGGLLRVITAATALSSQGTGITPQKRNANFATAITSAATATTCATNTTTIRTSVGFAQTGGMGGWVAIEPDAAIILLSGGGANGNAEFSSIVNVASALCDLTVEFSEG